MSRQNLRRESAEPEAAALAPGMQMEMRSAGSMRTAMTMSMFGEPHEDSTQIAVPSPVTHEEIDDGYGHNIGCYRARQHPGCE